MPASRSAASKRASPLLVAPVAPPVGEERRRQVRRCLVEQGSVRVAHLARMLAVSEETIRRDLRTLAEEGVAKTVHGGAVLLPGDAERLAVPPVDRRERLQQQGKQWIGAAAARFVQPRQVVILDAGTTAVCVAQHLRRHEGLTIVTNGLHAAQVCAGLPGATVHVVGGQLVPRSMSLIGAQAHRDLSKVRADWAFLGAAAVHSGSGFTSADPYEAEVKRAMIRGAQQVAIVADHTKFEARRFAIFAEAADVHFLFTTPGMPAAARRWLAKARVKVVECDGRPR